MSSASSAHRRSPALITFAAPETGRILLNRTRIPHARIPTYLARMPRSLDRHKTTGIFGVLLFFGIIPLAGTAQIDTTVAPVATDTSRKVVEPQLPVFTITADDLDSELGSQDISGILQSSRDVFTSTAGFNFGTARFRIRGFDPENTIVSINGVMVNDLESGWTSWSNWAGLNDVTRYPQVKTGVNSSRYNFGGIGGFTEINVRPLELRRGVRVSYASSNRAYRNRLMVTGSTGMQKNGWAFSFSGSRRWAEEGYIDGTFFDAYAYYLAAEKKLNDHHSISLAGFGAPIVQGRQGLAVQEAYDLAGTNYYNPNWGWQGDEKRNARVSFDHKPMIIASHIFRPDSATKLTTSLFYTFGRDGLTNLNWNDARDPRPDYYRYLPSYYSLRDPAYASLVTDNWLNDEGTRQIDWQQLYFANGKNLYTVDNANGSGNSITGNRSKYIVEEQRQDPTRIGVNSVWSRQLSNNRHLTIGGSFHKQRTHYFKVVDDLLGGDFWLDVDQFAQRDFNDTLVAQNDLDTPNKVVKDGDMFGYDYDINTTLIDVFSQFEKRFQRIEFYAGIDLAMTTFWRESRFRNGRFPDDSSGDGEKHGFFHYGVKAGTIYKLTGRHFITANVAYLTRPPISRNAYVSPRTRHQVIDGLTNESAYSGDISYLVRFSRVKGRATLYHARIMDQVWSRSFYHDEYLTLVNYVMKDVDQVHQGLELGLEASLTSTWLATGVLAIGDYRYDSRSSATITRDNSPEVFATDRTVFWKNYRIGGMPQTAASLGLRYNSPKFWFAGASVNYFDDIYLDPNPDRRTAEAIGNFVDTDPQVDQLLGQTKLDANMTVDLFAGKSWMIKGNRLAVNLTINNLLDNQDFRIGGFEQLRYDRSEIGRFPPKFSYMFGRNYFAMITYSF